MSDIPKGFTLIDDKDPSIPEGFSLLSPEEESYLEKGIGVVDTAVNMARGAVGQVAGGLSGLGALPFSGLQKATEVSQDVAKTIQGEPFTKVGKRYTENLSKFIEEDIRQPMIKQQTETAKALPINDAILDENTREFLATLGTDAFLNFFPLDLGLRGARAVKSTPKPKIEGPNKLDKLNELTKPQEVPKQDPLALFEGQGELDLFSPDQKQLGTSPYDAVGGKWTVDENGIPIKQMLSEEASRSADGGQGRLFEDPTQPVDPVIAKRRYEQLDQEYLSKQEAEFQAMKEKAFKEREEGIRRDLEDTRKADAEEALLKLQEELSQERVSKGQQRKADRLRVPRGQRGAIDAEVMKEIQELRDKYNKDKIQHDLNLLKDSDKKIDNIYTYIEKNRQKQSIDINKLLGEDLFSEFKTKNINKNEYVKPPGSRIIGGNRIKRGTGRYGRQSGAIDTEVVKEMTELFKRGAASARDLLSSWKGAFTENELGVAMKSVDNPKSLDTVAFMTPEQFHELATKRTPAELNAEYTPRLRESIREGLKSKNGLWEMPYLRIDNEGKVTAHEGRHRMDVFSEQGYELVPVRLRKEAGEGWGTWKAPETIIPQEYKNSPKAVQAIAAQPFPRVLHEPDMSPRLRGLAIPKTQRGGLDIKAIGEGAKELVNKIVKPRPPMKPPVIKDPKMSALKDAGFKDMIPKDPTASEILESSLGAGDSNLTMTGVQSGATLTGIKYNSPLIQGIGRLYQNAQKRSEKLIRDFVYPVEYAFKKLSKTEIIELAQLMKKEMLEQREFGAEQLRAAGYTEKQITAYTQMRDLFNRTYEAQAKALESQGRKVPTKREAYLSSRWSGDWHVPVYTKDGKLVYYIAEQTKAGANAALRYLEGQFDIDKSKSKVEYRAGFSKRGSAYDAYTTMLGMLDKNDPRAATIKSVMEDYLIDQGFNALGQKKHFESKAGIGGYLGDRPWKNEKTNAYDLFKSQFDYAKHAFTWAELQKATKTSKEVLSNEYLVQEQPNNLHYAQEYAKSKLGFGDATWVNDMENAANKMLGTSKQSFYNVVGDMKSFFIIQKLGLNAGFIGANMIQPVFTLPWHGNLVSHGIKHNPFNTFIKGSLDSFSGYAKYMFDVDWPMTEVGKAALQYAEDNGIVRRSMFDETANIGRHPGLEMAEKVGSTSIQTIEHSARLRAFMGFVHHLEQSKMFDNPMDMFQKAEELTNAAMVDYRQGEGPMMFDKAGLTGEALKTLQTFKFNYYNQLHYFLKEANEGRPSALLTFVGLQAMLGGALGMPFMQELDDIFNFLKENAPTDVHQYIQDFSPKQKLIETLPDWAAYGGFSKLTGANFSSRFDSGNLADLSLDGLFPFVSDIANQVTKMGKYALDPGNTSKQAEALYSIAPPGPAQGLLETGMDAFKGPKTEEGNQVYLNPRDVSKQDANFVRTPEQENYRRFGFTQLDEAKYKDLRFRQNKNEQQRVERRNELATKYFDAVIRGEKKDVEKYMYQYVRYDGDPQTLIDRLDDDMVRRRLPAETIQAMRAQSLTAVQKAKRMKEILNGYNK